MSKSKTYSILTIAAWYFSTTYIPLWIYVYLYYSRHISDFVFLYITKHSLLMIHLHIKRIKMLSNIISWFQNIEHQISLTKRSLLMSWDFLIFRPENAEIYQINRSSTAMWLLMIFFHCFFHGNWQHVLHTIYTTSM